MSNSEDFRPIFPMWTLIGKKSKAGDLPKGPTVLPDDRDQTWFIALFTSDSVADRFIKSVKFAHFGHAKINSIAELREWLRDYPERGVEFVGIDPIANPYRWERRFTIAQFLSLLSEEPA